MKAKHRRKILDYTESDNSSKLKHLVNKYKIDLSTLLFDNHNTLLHVACAEEAECVMRYCLREGFDPLLVNSKGQLALHVASERARKSSNSHIYTDMILPLIQLAPGSLDQPDNRGVTPRQLLQDVKHRFTDNLTSDSESSSSCESEGRGGRETSPDWEAKLAEAFQEEESEEWGRYAPSDYQEEELKKSHGDWFSDIDAEAEMRHRRKRQYAQPSSSRKPNPKASDPKSSDSKRPKKGISDEDKKRFEENLKQESRKHARALEELKQQKATEMRTRYEEQCTDIFSGTVTRKLSYRAIPWPHGPHEGLDDVERFVLGSMTRGTEAYKKELKAQRIRWHPDRFVQKVGQHLKDNDRERILEKVKQISQVLNSISD